MPKALPKVIYEGKEWFFDERLNELRDVETAEPRSLDSGGIEAAYFKKFYYEDLKELCDIINEKGSKLMWKHIDDKAVGFISQDKPTSLKQLRELLGCRKER